jgi:hypothetical protein
MADESRAVVVTLVALVASESRQLHLSPRTPMLSIIIITVVISNTHLTVVVLSVRER